MDSILAVGYYLYLRKLEAGIIYIYRERERFVIFQKRCSKFAPVSARDVNCDLMVPAVIPVRPVRAESPVCPEPRVLCVRCVPAVWLLPTVNRVARDVRETLAERRLTLLSRPLTPLLRDLPLPWLCRFCRSAAMDWRRSDRSGRMMERILFRPL